MSSSASGWTPESAVVVLRPGEAVRVGSGSGLTVLHHATKGTLPVSMVGSSVFVTWDGQADWDGVWTAAPGGTSTVTLTRPLTWSATNSNDTALDADRGVFLFTSLEHDSQVILQLQAVGGVAPIQFRLLDAATDGDIMDLDVDGRTATLRLKAGLALTDTMDRTVHVYMSDAHGDSASAAVPVHIEAAPTVSVEPNEELHVHDNVIMLTPEAMGQRVRVATLRTQYGRFALTSGWASDAFHIVPSDSAPTADVFVHAGTVKAVTHAVSLNGSQLRLYVGGHTLGVPQPVQLPSVYISPEPHIAAVALIVECNTEGVTRAVVHVVDNLASQGMQRTVTVASSVLASMEPATVPAHQENASASLELTPGAIPQQPYDVAPGTYEVHVPALGITLQGHNMVRLVHPIALRDPMPIATVSVATYPSVPCRPTFVTDDMVEGYAHPWNTWSVDSSLIRIHETTGLQWARVVKRGEIGTFTAALSVDVLGALNISKDITLYLYAPPHAVDGAVQTLKGAEAAQAAIGNKLTLPSDWGYRGGHPTYPGTLAPPTQESIELSDGVEWDDRAARRLVLRDAVPGTTQGAFYTVPAVPGLWDQPVRVALGGWHILQPAWDLPSTTMSNLEATGVTDASSEDVTSLIVQNAVTITGVPPEVPLWLRAPSTTLHVNGVAHENVAPLPVAGTPFSLRLSLDILQGATRDVRMNLVTRPPGASDWEPLDVYVDLHLQVPVQVVGIATERHAAKSWQDCVTHILSSVTVRAADGKDYVLDEESQLGHESDSDSDSDSKVHDMLVNAKVYVLNPYTKRLQVLASQDTVCLWGDAYSSVERMLRHLPERTVPATGSIQSFHAKDLVELVLELNGYRHSLQGRTQSPNTRRFLAVGETMRLTQSDDPDDVDLKCVKGARVAVGKGLYVALFEQEGYPPHGATARVLAITLADKPETAWANHMMRTMVEEGTLGVQVQLALDVASLGALKPIVRAFANDGGLILWGPLSQADLTELDVSEDLVLVSTLPSVPWMPNAAAEYPAILGHGTDRATRVRQLTQALLATFPDPVALVEVMLGDAPAEVYLCTTDGSQSEWAVEAAQEWREALAAAPERFHVAMDQVDGLDHLETYPPNGHTRNIAVLLVHVDSLLADDLTLNDLRLSNYTLIVPALYRDTLPDTLKANNRIILYHDASTTDPNLFMARHGISAVPRHAGLVRTTSTLLATVAHHTGCTQLRNALQLWHTKLHGPILQPLLHPANTEDEDED